jgi:hypothetical protein
MPLNASKKKTKQSIVKSPIIKTTLSIIKRRQKAYVLGQKDNKEDELLTSQSVSLQRLNRADRFSSCSLSLRKMNLNDIDFMKLVIP